ncbi:hypothetical protein M422DRAFT_272890 [Sphaerobolus stellatus SS14]|uniref:TLC domain-containing protein n=1 Tax=Sphaerobolus stellatus (strain SS14) TaxID=990650 RepID=A0A0C9TW80_SPHS4|nr:hypothetical protein M422DRAFT_272890 [Sphaerobolus stellatus SS14]
MGISILFNYSFPIVAIELCLIFLIVRLFLEPVFMHRIFHKSFPTMDVADQRSLTNHVISFVLKLVCFVGAYSALEIFISHKPLGAPLRRPGDERPVTNGDIIAFCYLTVPTIYLFKLVYRMQISIVSAIHHIAAITINIFGIIIIITDHQVGFIAETELKLILIYGIFEMCFEIFPHLAICLYRIYRDSPCFLRKLFLGTTLLIFTGTFLKQFAVGIFYFHVWKRLPLSYKVSGPIFHVCFMAAQIHGICLQISSKMRKECMDMKHQKSGRMLNTEPPSNQPNVYLDLKSNLEEANQGLVHSHSNGTESSIVLPMVIREGVPVIDHEIGRD